MAQARSKRKSITKKVRFEVFKRDSFQCQYCGASAPEVILNVDHIKPVAKGGDNDILNLITACFSCNSGKSDRELSDQTALSKQKAQLDEINAKREQLKLLQQYHDSLRGVDDTKVDYIAELMNSEMVTRSVSDTGLKTIKSWVKKFDYQVLIDSIEAASIQYLKFNGEGDCTDESSSKFFNYIPRIAAIKQKGDDQPNKEAYYIRGIIRNRGFNFTDYVALKLIQRAIDHNATFESLKDVAKNTKHWTQFKDSLESYINDKEAA